MSEKYIVFLSDSISFDMYDIVSSNEKFCMTHYEVVEAVEDSEPRIVTPSLTNLRRWDYFIELGYKVYIYKNNKKVEIYEGMPTRHSHLRKVNNLETVFLSGELNEYF